MSLPYRTLVPYALPAFALAALYLPLYSYVTPFYAAERGVDLAALGTAWLVIRLFDAVTDPAIGWLSDRTPGWLGRRRLWLGLAVPVLLVGTWNAFVPPEDAGLGHAVFWLFVVTLGWTMAQTPYAAWGAEIAPDYAGRTRVTAWREGVVLIGTLAATVAYVAGGLEAIALLVCIGLPVGVGAALVLVPDRSPERSRRLGLRRAVESLRANRPFRRVLAAWFVNGLANGVPVTLFAFFVQDFLGGDQETLGIMFALYFVSAIAGMPFWNWLSDRIGKHRAWCAAMIYACAAFAGVFLLGPGDIVAMGAISVLTGLAFGADLSLPPSIQADVVDADRRATGAARAGIFFAIWQVATKAALAVSSAVALNVLGASGFEAGQGNAPGALWTLALLYAGMPIVLKLAAVALMWNFPLGEAEVEGAAAGAA